MRVSGGQGTTCACRAVIGPPAAGEFAASVLRQDRVWDMGDTAQNARLELRDIGGLFPIR
jgi:hypothetical protein